MGVPSNLELELGICLLQVRLETIHLVNQILETLACHCTIYTSDVFK
jgi:hypothetical protein